MLPSMICLSVSVSVKLCHCRRDVTHREWQALHVGSKASTLYMREQMQQGLIPGAPGPMTMGLFVSRTVLAFNIMEEYLKDNVKEDWLQDLADGRPHARLDSRFAKKLPEARHQANLTRVMKLSVSLLIGACLRLPTCLVVDHHGPQ